VFGPQSYLTLAEDPTTSGTNQQKLENQLIQSLGSLYQAFNPNVLVFLVSFGSPHNGPTPTDFFNFAQLAREVNDIGGTYEAFLNLKTTDAYSLVAGLGTAVESSSTRTPNLRQGILRGVLGRGHQGNWYSVVSSSLAASADLDLYTIVAQAPQNWPVPSTPGQQQAFDWIGQQLCGGCSDLRLAYADDNITLPSWQAQLVALSYPAAQNPSFSAQDFAAVKGQVLTEFTYVSHVQQFRGNLATLWTDQQVNFALLAQEVGAKVTQAVQSPPASLVDKLLEAVIGKAIEVAEGILPARLGAGHPRHRRQCQSADMPQRPDPLHI
jgi:hypothetical protein